MNAEVTLINIALQYNWQMRVGRKLKRTLYLYSPHEERNYDNDICVGMVDSEILAATIVKLWNAHYDRNQV